MKRPPDLTSELKASDPELKNYLLELEKENLKLQERIGKFRAKILSQQNQIAALKKAQPKGFRVNIGCRQNQIAASKKAEPKSIRE